MNDLSTLNSVSENVHFWQQEMFKEWCNMLRYAFDVKLNSTEFTDAQQRFELARERARKEMLRLEE